MTRSDHRSQDQDNDSDSRVEALLADLARTDRAAAPASMEDRIFVATRSVLRSSAGAPAPVVRVIGPRRLVMAFRVAAAIGLVVTAGVVWRAVTSGSAATTIPAADITHLSEAELDELASMLAMYDEGVADELHSISNEAERVSGSLSDLFGDSTEG